MRNGKCIFSQRLRPDWSSRPASPECRSPVSHGGPGQRRSAVPRDEAAAWAAEQRDAGDTAGGDRRSTTAAGALGERVPSASIEVALAGVIVGKANSCLCRRNGSGRVAQNVPMPPRRPSRRYWRAGRSASTPRSSCHYCRGVLDERDVVAVQRHRHRLGHRHQRHRASVVQDAGVAPHVFVGPRRPRRRI